MGGVDGRSDQVLSPPEGIPKVLGEEALQESLVSLGKATSEGTP